MAATKEALLWFEGFKKILHEKGLDTSDPMITPLLSGFTMDPIPGVEEILLEHSFYIGTPDEVEMAPDSETQTKNDPTHYEGIDGFESLDWFKHFTPIDQFSDDTIERLYHLAKNGHLYVTDKGVHLEDKQYFYVKDDGTAGLSAPVSTMGKGPAFTAKVQNIEREKEEMRQAFPAVSTYETLFKQSRDHETAANSLATAAEFAGTSPTALLISKTYRKSLLADYFKNPEFYSTPENAAARVQLMKAYAIAHTDQDYADKHPELDAHEIGGEKEITQSILAVYNNKYTLDELLIKGLLRKPDGTKFKPQPYPWGNALQFCDYITSEDNKLVFYDVQPSPTDNTQTIEKRLGHMKVSVTSGSLKTYPDSPDKGNDYSFNLPKNLEPAEISAELITFIESLPTLLKKEADLDVSVPSDAVRLKSFYIGTKSTTGNFEEVDMLTTWTASEGNCVHFESHSNIPASSLLSGVENEIQQNNFSLTSALVALKAKTIDQVTLHHLYAIMQQAKNGNLIVLKPGEPGLDGHPVVVGQDGKAQVLPSYKDVTREQQKFRPYSTLTANLRHTKAVKDPNYVADLQRAHETLDTSSLVAEEHALDAVLSGLVSQANNRAMSKEKFLQDIVDRSMETNTNLNEVYNVAKTKNSNLPAFKFPVLSSKESAKRSALSRQALRNFASTLYDTENLLNPLRDAVKQGEITQAELDEITSSKGYSALLFDLDNTSEAAQYNIDTVKMITGKGTSENDPDALDVKAKMEAGLINRTLETITSADYSKWANLSDEALVANWPEIYRTFYPMSVLKDELLKIQSRNEYVDQALAKKCYALESKYGKHLSLLSQRMQTIANPYYAKVDASKLLQLDSKTLSAIIIREFSSDLHLSRFMQDLSKTQQFSAEVLGSTLCSALMDAGAAKDSSSARFFDVDGHALDLYGCYDAILSGETVLAGSYEKPGTVIAMKKSKNGYIQESPEKHSTAMSQISSQLTQLKTQKEAELANGMGAASNAYLYSPNLSYAEACIKLANDATDRNVDRATIIANLVDHFKNKRPNLTQEQFMDALTKIGSHPVRITREEMLKRQTLTVKAHQANLDFAFDCAEAFHPSNRSLIKCNNKRFFEYGMLKYGGKADIKYNEDIISKMFTGTPEVKKATAEAALQSIMDDTGDLFDHPLSDSQLVENWSKLRRAGVALGLEYNNVIGMLKDELGITLSPELMKKLDAFHEKAYNFENYYLTRMGNICSPYYQYDNEKCLDSGTKAAMLHVQSKDPEMVKFALSNQDVYYQKMITYGGYAIEQCGMELPIEAVYDANGNRYDSNADAQLAIGEALATGQTLYFIGKGGNAVKSFTYDISQGFPIQPTEKETTLVGRRDMIFDNKLTMIERDETLSPAEKDLASDIVSEHYKLSAILINPKSPTYDGDLKTCMINLLTKITIQKYCKAKGLDGESVASINTPKNVKKFAKAIHGSVGLEKMIQHLPKDPNEIIGLGSDTLYAKLAHEQKLATDELSQSVDVEKQKQVERIELQARKNLAATRDKDAEKRIEAIAGPKELWNTVKTKEFFTPGLTDQTIQELKSMPIIGNMNLSRTAIQSLSLSLMLAQGINVEDALNPDKCANERKICGKAAVDVLKADDYKTVRENYLKALNVIGEYMDQKMSNMKDFSLTEFAKPENRNLYALSILAKDISQEIQNCQRRLPKSEPRLKGDTYDKICNRTEILGNIVTNIYNGLNVSSKTDLGGYQSSLVSSVISSCMSSYVTHFKSQPESAGKNLSQIMNLEKVFMFTAAQDSIVRTTKDVGLPYWNDSICGKTFTAIQDDTLHNELDIKMQINEEGIPSFTFNLDHALKVTSERKVPEKKAPVQEKPVPSKSQKKSKPLIKS